MENNCNECFHWEKAALLGFTQSGDKGVCFSINKLIGIEHHSMKFAGNNNDVALYYIPVTQDDLHKQIIESTLRQTIIMTSPDFGCKNFKPKNYKVNMQNATNGLIRNN